MVEALMFTLELALKEENFSIGQGETQYQPIWAWGVRRYMIM